MLNYSSSKIYFSFLSARFSCAIDGKNWNKILNLNYFLTAPHVGQKEKNGDKEINANIIFIYIIHFMLLVYGFNNNFYVACFRHVPPWKQRNTWCFCCYTVRTRREHHGYWPPKNWRLARLASFFALLPSPSPGPSPCPVAK